MSRRIIFRIGINVRDVVAERDYLLGDGVNIAARLAGMSEPGSILILDVTHCQVCKRMDAGFRDDGLKTLRNIAGPVLM